MTARLRAKTRTAAAMAPATAIHTATFLMIALLTDVWGYPSSATGKPRGPQFKI